MVLFFLFFSHCGLLFFSAEITQAYGQLGRSVYTFGSPRVGTAPWAAWFNGRVPDNWRYVHYSDLVTSVPPTWTGFVHVGREVWLPDVGAQPTKICNRATADGKEDTSCSYSLGIWKKLSVMDRIDDHGLYLGLTFGCGGARFQALTTQQKAQARHDTIEFVAALSGVRVNENETTEQIIEKLQHQPKPVF